MGYLQFILDKACARKLPVSGTFELTSRCNLSCRMCYIHRAEQDASILEAEKPASFWLDMAEQLRDAGTLTLLITGGEPLLRPDFRQIYLACKQAGFVVSVNTNGTLITEDTVRFFQKFPPRQLNVSLYGASDETYQALCGRAGMYERTVSAIRRLHAAGISVRLNYTVTPWNAGDIDKIYRFAEEVGVPVEHTAYLFPPVRTGENKVCRLSPEEAAGADFRCLRKELGAEVFSERCRMIANGMSSVEVETDACSRCSGERILCRAGTSAFWITWDGRLLPCGMLPEPAVSLESRTFAEAWQEIQSETQKIFLPAECKSCPLRPWCHVCAAVCHGENHRFDVIPDYQCRFTRELLRLYRAEAEKEAGQ